MITPKHSQDYFVIFHVDDSDGYWINIERTWLTRDLTNEEFAYKIVNNILKKQFPDASRFDIYFRDSDGEEFFKEYGGYDGNDELVD